MVIVRDYMRKDISTIDIDDSVFEASKMMSSDKVCYIIVRDNNQPAGIVTMNDLVLKVMAEDKDPKTVKVSECMSSPLITIDPDRSVDEAVETMKKHGLKRLPVVKNDTMYGIFCVKDLIEHYDEFERKLVTDIIRVIRVQ
jgi:CBS domain-containing protein